MRFSCMLTTYRPEFGSSGVSLASPCLIMMKSNNKKDSPDCPLFIVAKENLCRSSHVIACAAASLDTVIGFLNDGT